MEGEREKKLKLLLEQFNELQKLHQSYWIGRSTNTHSIHNIQSDTNIFLSEQIR